jgi:hypothetical protein
MFHHHDLTAIDDSGDNDTDQIQNRRRRMGDQEEQQISGGRTLNRPHEIQPCVRNVVSPCSRVDIYISSFSIQIHPDRSYLRC